MSNISDWFESKCGPELLRRVAAFVVMLMVIQLAATALQKLFSLWLPNSLFTYPALDFLLAGATLYLLWRVLGSYRRREQEGAWYLRWGPQHFVLALLALSALYSVLNAAVSVAAAFFVPFPPELPEPWPLYVNLLLYGVDGLCYAGLAALCLWWCEIRWHERLRAGAALLCFYVTLLAVHFVAGRLVLVWMDRQQDTLVRQGNIYLGAIESDNGWYYHFGLFDTWVPVSEPQYLLFLTLAFLQYVPFLLLGWLAYVLYHRSRSLPPISTKSEAE